LQGAASGRGHAEKHGDDQIERTEQVPCRNRRLCAAVHALHTGYIEGEADMLTRAFRAGSASIVLADGQLMQVALSDPGGSSTAEVRLSDGFPRLGDAA
jgi:hypothetical protein